MKYLTKFLALSLAAVSVCALVPGRAEAAAATVPRVNFENQVRLNTKFFKDTYFDDNTYFGVSGFWLPGTRYNANVIIAPSLGQQTVFTVPDPGTATAAFLVGAGATTYTVPNPSGSANVLLDVGSVSAVTIQHVAVPLSAANLIAMYTTPVALIAAGAAGTNIVVHKFMLTMVSTATQFTGGGVVAPQIGTAAHGAGTLTTATVAASVVTAAAGTSYSTTIPVSYTSTSATGLYLSNQTAAFAAGTGTAVADIWYSIK